jgi:hypothetical protein
MIQTMPHRPTVTMVRIRCRTFKGEPPESVLHASATRQNPRSGGRVSGPDHRARNCFMHDPGYMTDSSHLPPHRSELVSETPPGPRDANRGGVAFARVTPGG